MLKSVNMTVQEFIDVPENPIQRDTQRHAKIYSRPGGHLHDFHPTHLRVAICETPEGRQFKLDGHTRAYLWQKGELEIPAHQKLRVDVYDVKDRDEAMDYYLCFDADGSHETSVDKLTGAFKFHRFTPKHPWMFRGVGLVSAMQHLVFEPNWGDAKHLTYVQLLKPWIRVLKQIDSLDPYFNTHRFPSFVTAAQLLSVRRDGVQALEFWQRYHDDAGTKSQQTVDGVYRATEVLIAFKNPVVTAAKVPYKKGRRIAELGSKVLYCYDMWQTRKRLPISVGRGGRQWDKALPLKQWWEENLGDLDHPEIRRETARDKEEKKARELEAAKAKKQPRVKLKKSKKKAAKK